MQAVTEFLTAARGIVFRFVEAGVAVVAIIVLVYLLLGEASGWYVNSVVDNLVVLIEKISSQTLVAIAIVIAAYAIMRAKR
ncbi:MAG: hypothetical protein CFH41_01036 [Alphaproteobacteria bacterium MarineAlpha11_Bin1]|nr:MAG: hypothetical protein CFH41_01036 [Alphaproteobacteria bacterium MarineAlpha11_Bin1]|tara:strand:- start:12890 stop:13132 length:243 start_codon:yes stop_codon:yes gene_type:complete